jgi:hypothetical protein
MRGATGESSAVGVEGEGALCRTQKLSRDDSGPEKKSRLSDPFSCRRTSQRLALELWLPPTSNQRPNRGAPAS